MAQTQCSSPCSQSAMACRKLVKHCLQGKSDFDEKGMLRCTAASLRHIIEATHGARRPLPGPNVSARQVSRMTYSQLIDRDTELNERSILFKVAPRALIYIRELTPYRGPQRVMIHVETILIPSDTDVEQYTSHLCRKLPPWPTECMRNSEISQPRKSKFEVEIHALVLNAQVKASTIAVYQVYGRVINLTI